MSGVEASDESKGLENEATRSIGESDPVSLLADGVAALRTEDYGTVDPTTDVWGDLSLGDICPPKFFEVLRDTFHFDKPTKVQETLLPLAVQGYNIVCQSPTGSGKTMVFAVQALNVVDPYRNELQVVWFAPTRELVNQVFESWLMPLSATVPGVRILQGISQDRTAPHVTYPRDQPPHILIGTPGKLKDWFSKRKWGLNSRTIKLLVVDEADQVVLPGGFADELNTILGTIPRTCQKLFFSATLKNNSEQILRNLAISQGRDMRIFKPQTMTTLVLPEIHQVWMDARKCPGGKVALLERVYSTMQLAQSMVFANTRARSQEVALQLSSDGYQVAWLNGELEKTERDRRVREFKQGKFKVLVCTNVAERGLDVMGLTVVVNYELPEVFQTGQRREAFHDRRRREVDATSYLHRIGRTGRAGKKGVAISFVESDEEIEMLRMIEHHYDSPGMIQELLPDGLEELNETHKRRQEQTQIEPALEPAPEPEATADVSDSNFAEPQPTRRIQTPSEEETKI